MTIYDKQIISILAKAGERGMSVKKIGMQLYNINCTLFSTPDFTDIHRYVQQFLFRNSRLSQSLFCSDIRGIYKLNPNSARAQQLVLNFADKDNEEEEEEVDDSSKSSSDLSLSLFDELF